MSSPLRAASRWRNKVIAPYGLPRVADTNDLCLNRAIFEGAVDNASFLKPDDVASIAFWKSAMIIGPIVALALPLAAAWLLGGYDRIDWFGRVTFFQSLGILSPMCFPFGVYFYASADGIGPARTQVARGRRSPA
jgi:hypothetical protein